ncbi:MAG: hypothetical protein JWO38_929 [Gemmataceae bacterium]|nr:hypothetical protein [Gemmataceae bacterium]
MPEVTGPVGTICFFCNRPFVTVQGAADPNPYTLCTYCGAEGVMSKSPRLAVYRRVTRPADSLEAPETVYPTPCVWRAFFGPYGMPVTWRATSLDPKVPNEAIPPTPFVAGNTTLESLFAKPNAPSIMAVFPAFDGAVVAAEKQWGMRLDMKV